MLAADFGFRAVLEMGRSDGEGMPGHLRDVQIHVQSHPPTAAHLPLQIFSDQNGRFALSFFQCRDFLFAVKPVVLGFEGNQPYRPNGVARQNGVSVQRPDPVLVHSKQFQKLLASCFALMIFKGVGPQLFRINLQKLHAERPIHVQGLREFPDNFAILRPLHAPVHLVQNPHIRGLQDFDFLGNLLQVHPSYLLSAFLGLLAFLLHLGHEAVLVGQEELYVVELQPSLNVPTSDAKRGTQFLDFKRAGFGPAIIGLIVDERGGGNQVELLCQFRAERLIQA